MMRKSALLVAVLLSLAACDYDRDGEISRPLRTETRAIDSGGAESVRAEVRMGAGDLNISGGAQRLMESEFRYNRPAWKPDVRYSVSGLHGTLTVQQPAGHTMNVGHAKNEWKLKFNDDARMDLAVALGAGEGTLNLSTLSLRGLDIRVGAGALHLDLRGNPRHSYDVRIRGGVGEANIYLPTKVGVIADARGGIGGISARGMEKRGGSYVNHVYEKSGITIHLDIKGGIGEINLICE